MALREILAHFGVSFDDKALKQGESRIESLIGSVKSFAGAAAGAFAVNAIYEFVHGLTEEADALAKQSQTMGMSLAAMQEWNYAAMMQGVSAEALSTSLAKLSAGKYDAKGMAELGVKVKDTAGHMKSGEEILGDVADRLSDIDDPAKRNALAMKVLGRNYKTLMPLLLEGKDGIQELRDEFKEMGGGFTDEFAKDADAFGDNVDRLKTRWKLFGITAVGAVLPRLVKLTDWLAKTVPKIIAFVSNTKILQAVAIAAGLKGLGAFSKALGPLGAGLKALSRQFFTVIAPLLILEDFLVFLAGGDSLFGRLVDKIGGDGSQKQVRDWVDDVKKEFQGFLKDVKSNPATLEDDWKVFTEALRTDIKKTFGDTFGNQLNALGFWFTFVLDLMTGGWTNFQGKTTAVWDAITAVARGAWIEFETGWKLAIAVVEDHFTLLWNTILSGIQGTLRAMGKVVSIVPGQAGFAKDITDMATGLESQKGAGDAAKRVTVARDAARAQNEGAATSAVERMGAAGVVGSNNTTTTTVNVIVPPGTPEELAGKVGTATGAAVGDVTKKNLRATQAVLKPGGT